MPVEKHHAFMKLLDEVNVSEKSHWNEVIKVIQDDPRYLAVESLARKRQLFAQKVSGAWKDKVSTFILILANFFQTFGFYLLANLERLVLGCIDADFWN